MKQAVIFDLDGTLADTLSSIAFLQTVHLYSAAMKKSRSRNTAISSETARNDWCTGCLHA